MTPQEKNQTFWDRKNHVRRDKTREAQDRDRMNAFQLEIIVISAYIHKAIKRRDFSSTVTFAWNKVSTAFRFGIICISFFVCRMQVNIERTGRDCQFTGRQNFQTNTRSSGRWRCAKTRWPVHCFATIWWPLLWWIGESISFNFFFSYSGICLLDSQWKLGYHRSSLLGLPLFYGDKLSLHSSCCEIK